jgi:integrase
VSKITGPDVAAWVQDILDGTAPTRRTRAGVKRSDTRSASVAIRCLGVLRGILDMAVDARRIPRNPAAGLKNQPRKPPKVNRRYLTDAEVTALAAAVNDPLRSTLVYVLAYTGLRWGEAVGLRVRDCNPLRHRLHVRRSAVQIDNRIEVGAPKTWEHRTVPYPEFLDRLLAARMEDAQPDDLLFPGHLDGYQRRPDTFEGARTWFRTATIQAGLERLTIHDLRHTAASLAIASGAHVKAVQRMLGHASAAMTLDTYADLFDTDLDDVAERMGARGAAVAEATITALSAAS